jgi:uncharacterized protein (TIGR01440 family)
MMSEFIKESEQFKELLDSLQESADFAPGSLIVLGASSSEVLGEVIGTGTSAPLAAALLPVILDWAKKHGLLIAVQCCEHINRSLVVEKTCAERFGLEAVSVVPRPGAGGGFASAAMRLFEEPLVVESLLQKADGGIDIGDTLISMHMKRVVVAVRLPVKQIGEANVRCAKSRPMLIGGERAAYI